MRALLSLICLASCTPPVALPAQDPSPAVTQPAPAATAQAIASAPFVVGQDWSGKYACSRGETLVIVHIERVDGQKLEGALLFREQATGESGSYDVSGTFDAFTGLVSLDAGDWIERVQDHTKERVSGVLRDRAITGWFGTPTCRISLSLSDGLPTLADPED